MNTRVVRIVATFTLIGVALVGDSLVRRETRRPEGKDVAADMVSHPGLAALTKQFDAIEAQFPLDELTRAVGTSPEDTSKAGGASSESPGWADIRRFDPATALRIMSMYPLELKPREYVRSAALNPRDIPLSPSQIDAVAGILDLMRPRPYSRVLDPLACRQRIPHSKRARAACPVLPFGERCGG